MKRTATARWNGSLKEGNGVISTASGVLDDTQYSFGTRFEDGQGTNPEELIGAAHAGCVPAAMRGLALRWRCCLTHSAPKDRQDS